MGCWSALVFVCLSVWHCATGAYRFWLAVFPYAARSYTPSGPLQDDKHVWGVGWAEAVATLQVDAAVAETIAFNGMHLTASLVLHCSPL
jgi:hypothetical protein